MKTPVEDLRTSAHIVSWRIHKGEISKGMCVCHTCDNRKCTNPDHLFLGTHQENMSDRDEKKRQAHGEDQWASKLNEKNVREIKLLLKLGVPYSKIASRYQVTDGCIWFIKNGKNWKHVEI